MTDDRPAMAPILTTGRSQASAGPAALMPTAIGSGTLSCGVVDDAGEDERDRDVENGADRERAQDADRHVALRVRGFLRRRGDGVESDVGEEDDARAAHDAVPAVLARAFGGGNEGRPVVAR